MEKKSHKILNEKELRVFWDNFSEMYSTLIEPATILVAKNFVKTLMTHRETCKLTDTDLDYLELACGSGQFAVNFFEEFKEKLRRATLVDLSGEMVEKTKCLLEANAERLSLDINPSGKSEESLLRVELHQENVENIDFVKDCSVDLLISNLVLHLVESPSKMLLQSYRVLKPGHVGYFSVLAEYQDSTIFNTIPTLLKKFGFTGTGTRSILYLGQEEVLKGIIPKDKFDILGTQLIRLDMPGDEKNVTSFMGLQRFSAFVDSLEEGDKQTLLKEHGELLEEFRQGKRQLVYHIRAVFVRKK